MVCWAETEPENHYHENAVGLWSDIQIGQMLYGTRQRYIQKSAYNSRNQHANGACKDYCPLSFWNCFCVASTIATILCGFGTLEVYGIGYKLF